MYDRYIAGKSEELKMYISNRVAKSIIDDFRKGINGQISIVDWDGACLGSTNQELGKKSEVIVGEYIQDGNIKNIEKKYGVSFHTVYLHTQFLCYLLVFSEEIKGLISYAEAIIHWKCQLEEKNKEEGKIEVRRLLTSQLTNSGRKNYEIQSYCKQLGISAAEKRCAILFLFQGSILISELGNSVKNVWERLERHLQQKTEYEQDIYGPLNNGHFLLFKSMNHEEDIKTVIDYIREYIQIVTRGQVRMVACVGSVFQEMKI